MRRAAAIIRPKWMSAVASVTIGGTTVTGMPRLVASATSILSGVIDIEQTARNFGLAASTARSILSCKQRHQNVGLLHRRDQFRLGEDLARVGVDDDIGHLAQPLERAFARSVA